jgi:hypothetical protein
MGDFNLDWEENKNLDSNNYIDLWTALRKENEESFTMKKNSYFPEWRPDRICLKKTGFYKPTKIERIGMEPIEAYKNVNLT